MSFQNQKFRKNSVLVWRGVFQFSTTMNIVPQFDENLWFMMENHCEGKHYLLGNPHTFKGRISAWCPQKKASFFFSKSEIGECSNEAHYWIKGFLAGNEPEPKTDENGDIDFESEEYKNWLKKVEDFRKTGIWQG